ncbi:MAG: hypothetical protein AAGF12_02710 [Myxococcota bacterium]
MTYMIDQADRVSVQLERFATAYDHHVVGQFANLEFWLNEVDHAQNTINNYEQRFRRMAKGQRAWIEAHDTRVGSYCPICRDACELEAKWQKPQRPERVSSKEREQAVRRLKDAAYRFLLRCFRVRLLDEEALRAACGRVGTGVEPKDLYKYAPSYEESDATSGRAE